MTTPSVLRPYDAIAGIQTLGNLWTLTRGDRTLACRLTTHPMGWELRADVRDELARSQVCRSSTEVLDVADDWRREATTRGWIAAAD